jgi:beta-lactamase regulating signal transducer with metallopeptidase domain
MSTFQSVADGWAVLAWTVTWQLAALALLACVCGKALRLRQPRVRHALWWFVLVAPLVLAPVRLLLAHREAVVSLAAPAPIARTLAAVPAVFSTDRSAAPRPVDSGGEGTSSGAPINSHPWWQDVRPVDALLLTWLLGCTALGLRLIVGHVQVRGMLSEGHPVEDVGTLGLLRALCAEARVRSDVELRGSEAVGAPLLCGLVRPVVVVPDDWVSTLPQDDLRALLAHEVAHIKRLDFLANLAQRVIEALLFFHPFAWVASRRITLAREELCDAWAVQRGGDAADYARCLAAAAERAHVHIPAASVGVAESRFTLLQRVEAIMRTASARRSGRPIMIGLAVLLAVSAAALAAVQVREPQGEPPKSQARQQEQCVTNMKQLGLACILYAMDSDGTLPPAARWCDAIRPYLRSEAIHQCLADKKKYSYAMNSNLSSKKWADISAKAAARTVLLFESTQGRKNASDRGASWPRTARHAQGNCVAFADGSVIRTKAKPDFSLNPKVQPAFQGPTVSKP